MSLVHAIGLTALPHIGGLAAAFSNQNQIKNWYNVEIKKPNWRPPNWLFAPAWTTLYTSMGYASYLIYRDGLGDQRKTALALYGSQLVLNWLWSPLFFNFHKLGLAAAEMFLLLANIGVCIWKFYPINKTASYLMLPYIAWVSFAFCLNLDVWQRNKKRKD